MIGDGVAFSFMVGAGESYVPAFALALGFGDVVAGLVATTPMLAGAVLQLVSPWAVGRLGSHRRWVVGCAALQAASFLPLIAGAIQGWMPVLGLFAAASLYWGFGMATGPAWNTWAGTLVPARIRSRYFANRAVWSQLALVVGLGLAGLLLDVGSRNGRTVQIFVWVFAAAMASRAISVWFLSRQSEPLPVPIGDTRISFAALHHDLLEGSHGRLLGYLLGFQLAVWIAAPFFVPYMLGTLGLSYGQFTVLTGTAFLARVLVLPLAGRIAHRVGTRRVLWVGSIGIVPLPALWLVSDQFAWLIVLQLLGGTVWAAFELTTLLSFFEHIPPERRTAILSIYNLANAAAIVVGAAIGGALLDALGGGRAAYAWLLLASSAARLLPLPLLRGAPDSHPPARGMTLRTLAVRPSSGALQRPVLPAIPSPE